IAAELCRLFKVRRSCLIVTLCGIRITSKHVAIGISRNAPDRLIVIGARLIQVSGLYVYIASTGVRGCILRIQSDRFSIICDRFIETTDRYITDGTINIKIGIPRIAADCFGGVTYRLLVIAFVIIYNRAALLCSM